VATRLAYEHLNIPYRMDPGTLGLWDGGAPNGNGK
jgi:hypothetical protein